METTIIFANGLTWERPSDKAPENLRGKLYVKAETFKKFLDENVNERGYVNLNLWKSKKDGEKLYFSLDTWKPTPKDSQENTDDFIDPSSIPF